MSPSHSDRALRPGFAPAALFALVLVATLPALLRLPPVDRDESRFARGARETLELPSGERLLPVLDGRPRLDKPPLSAWLQMAAIRLAGDRGAAAPSIVPHRLPSLLAALIAVLAAWRLGRRLLRDGAGSREDIALLGAALFAVAPLTVWEAAEARADLLLVAATTVALALLAPAVLEPSSGRLPLPRALGGWAAVGLALLAKGPIALLIVLPPLLLASRAETRRAAWTALRPVAGTAVVLLLASAWLAPLARAGLLSELAATAWRELPGRALAPREGHSGYPGIHLLLALALYWPASLGFPLAARDLWRGWRRRESVDRFLVFWIVPAWLTFELAATKLPHYTLPLAPALAFAAARALTRAETMPSSLPTRGGTTALRGLAALWRWGTLIATPALLFALASAPAKLGAPAFAAVALFALAALGLHLFSSDAWSAGRKLPALRGATVLAAAGSALALGALLPAQEPLWIGPRTAAAARALDPGAERPLAAAGWAEESLRFALAGRLQRLEEGAGADWLARHPDGLLIHDAGFAIAGATRRAELAGFDYVKGRKRTIAISTASAVADRRLDMVHVE